VLHPAMLLHWRVQGAAVGLLERRDRDRYRYLFSDRVVGDLPLGAYPVRGKAEPEGDCGGASLGESVVGGSEFRSDPDFLSGVPVEREPRWDSSPERVTPPPLTRGTSSLSRMMTPPWVTTRSGKTPGCWASLRGTRMGRVRTLSSHTGRGPRVPQGVGRIRPLTLPPSGPGGGRSLFPPSPSGI
jgi:hypothetical protein